MSNDQQENQNQLIDFEKRKGVHVHLKKEQKLKSIQNAFEKALPLKPKNRKKSKKNKIKQN